MPRTANPQEKALLQPRRKVLAVVHGDKGGLKRAGRQVIFPLTKKTTFVRFIEVITKSIFLPSVSCFFLAEVTFLTSVFLGKEICQMKGGEGE
jgi:hypothetical protein